MLLLSPSYRKGTPPVRPERTNKLPKITQLVSGRVRMWTEVAGFPDLWPSPPPLRAPGMPVWKRQLGQLKLALQREVKQLTQAVPELTQAGTKQKLIPQHPSTYPVLMKPFQGAKWGEGFMKMSQCREVVETLTVAVWRRHPGAWVIFPKEQ